MDELKIPEKFILSIREAALYFGMGEKKIRRLAEDNEGDFALYNGNRYLVIRPLMEQYFTELAKKGGTQDAESNTGKEGFPDARRDGRSFRPEQTEIRRMAA